MKRWGTAELSLPVRCPLVGADRTSFTDGVFGSELTAHCTTIVNRSHAPKTGDFVEQGVQS